MVAAPQGTLWARRRLVQYLSLELSDILPPRDPSLRFRPIEEGQLRVVTQFRVQHGFGRFREAAKGPAGRLLDLREDRQLDVLIGYIEGTQLGGVLDLRLGRQMDPANVDFFAMDGLMLRLGPPGAWRPYAQLELWGGSQVRAQSPLGLSGASFEGLGNDLGDARAPEERGYLVGAALLTQPRSWWFARFGYRRAFASQARTRIDQNSAVLADPPSAFAGGVEQSLLFAQGRVTDRRSHISLNGSASYELASLRLTLAEGSLQWMPSSKHRLAFTALRTVPVLDLDSIYSVMFVGAYSQLALRYTWRDPRGIQVTVQPYTRRRNDPAAPRNAAQGVGGSIGAGIGPASSRIGVRSEFYREALWTQWSNLLRWDLIGQNTRWTGALQLHYALAHRGRIRQLEHETALALTADLRLYEGVRIRALFEEMTSTRIRHSFRIFGALSFDANLRVGGR